MNFVFVSAWRDAQSGLWATVEEIDTIHYKDLHYKSFRVAHKTDNDNLEKLLEVIKETTGEREIIFASSPLSQQLREIHYGTESCTEGIYADSGLKKLETDYGMKVEFGKGERTFQLNTEISTNIVELKLNDQLIAKFLPSDIQYLGKMFTQFHQQVFE